MKLSFPFTLFVFISILIAVASCEIFRPDYEGRIINSAKKHYTFSFDDHGIIHVGNNAVDYTDFSIYAFGNGWAPVAKYPILPDGHIGKEHAGNKVVLFIEEGILTRFYSDPLYDSDGFRTFPISLNLQKGEIRFIDDTLTVDSFRYKILSAGREYLEMVEFFPEESGCYHYFYSLYRKISEEDLKEIRNRFSTNYGTLKYSLAD